MQVLSINCNKFGGSLSNGKGEEYNKQVVAKFISIIDVFLDLDDENVVFLEEINNANNKIECFENLFDSKVYTIHKPSRFDEFNNSKHPYGCTIAITKNNLFWKKSNSIFLEDSEDGTLCYANKSVILEHEDIVLIGIHMPYNMEYWDALIDYFCMNINKKIYIIGDLNVCDEGTDRKEKFNELTGKGAIDVWKNKGCDEKHITCNSDRRLDYLLTSTIGYLSIKKMSYIDSIRFNKISDHSGICFEL